jgi:hypothetical protein
MAAAKILSKYSTKYKKSTKPKKKSSTSKVKKKPQKKKIYTYILKDIDLDIYKIGKTTAPTSRFKSLCVRGRIMPIALAGEDVEKKLHEEFADLRMTHPEFPKNGGTEWFRRGGQLDEFIEGIDKGYFLPYITVHQMLMEFLESGTVKTSDAITQWELSQSTYGYYLLGLKLLVMLKIINEEAVGLTTKYNKHVMILNRKISVSEAMIDKIKSKYEFYASVETPPKHIQEQYNKKEGSKIRKVTIESEAFDSDIYILMSEK